MLKKLLFNIIILMLGAIMQLAAIGIKNAHLKNIYSNEYVTIDFNNDVLIIPKGGADLFIPLYLSFVMKDNVGLEKFNELLIDATVNLMVGNTKLYSLDLEFLSKLNPIKKVNNSFLINLPFNFLLGHLNLIGLSHSQVIINVTINMNYIEQISGIFENIYLESYERNNYANKYLYQKILSLRKINDIELNYVNNNFNYNLVLKTSNAPGLFICLEKHIKNIQITLDDKYYNFNDCQIINDKLMYFSFNKLDYKDKKNLIVKTKTINNITISMENPTAKFYLVDTSFINYNSGMFLPFYDIYGPNILNIKDEIIKYNMYIEMTEEPIEIK